MIKRFTCNKLGYITVVIYAAAVFGYHLLEGPLKSEVILPLTVFNNKQGKTLPKSSQTLLRSQRQALMRDAQNSIFFVCISSLHPDCFPQIIENKLHNLGETIPTVRKRHKKQNKRTKAKPNTKQRKPQKRKQKATSEGFSLLKKQMVAKFCPKFGITLRPCL